MDNSKKIQKVHQNDQSEDETDMLCQSFRKTLEDIPKDPSKITATEEVKAQKDAGFQTAPDGKPIITDDAFDNDDNDNDDTPRPSEDVDTDTDDSETDPLEAMAKKRVFAMMGIKIASDGSLILIGHPFDIDDDDDDDDIDTDTDDTDAEKENSKPSKLRKPIAKHSYDYNLRSGKFSRVRRSSRIRTSTATVGSKYKAGGKSIHRK